MWLAFARGLISLEARQLTSRTVEPVRRAAHERQVNDDKLVQVARLSRMVDQLSLAGLRQRHPTIADEMIRYRRAELRLGRELTARVYGAQHGVA